MSRTVSPAMRVAVPARRWLTSPSGYLKLVFVLLGAALALSFLVLDTTLIAMLAQNGEVPLPVTLVMGTLIVVAPVLGLGLTPPVRQVEGVAAESLLGVRFPDGAPPAASTWPERRRSLGWFVLHVLVGAVALVMVVGLVPIATSLVWTALSGASGQPVLWLDWTGLRTSGSWTDLWFVPAGVGLLVVTVAGVAVLGVMMAHLAPGLLGPTYDERLRRLEEETARLVERNRIAREIHDSVGHALSVVTVQAAAARKVIDRDRDFAVEALTAIEDASKNAAADLDHVLGLLREDGEQDRADRGRGPAPDLSGLPFLVSSSRTAGLDVRLAVQGDVELVPTLISRETYRIAQEGLTNALRHSSSRDAELRVDRSDAALRVVVENPHRGGTGRGRARTGRGLRGIEERVQALGGTVTHGSADGVWRLEVRIPLQTGGQR